MPPARPSKAVRLAAGLIAFGAGLVIAALIPATEAEQRASQRVVDAAQPLVDEAKSVGQDVGSNLKESAADAAQQVKDTAQDSVQRVQDEGKSSARDREVRGARTELNDRLHLTRG